MLRAMTDARHRWVFPDPMRLDPAFREAARAAGLGTFAATVLARRGIADEAALAAFLGPGASPGCTTPGSCPDAALVVERIARARAGGERVMVFGDFDADGLTGLAQLVIALRRLGSTRSRTCRRGSRRATACRWPRSRPRPTGGVALIITVDTGLHERRRGRRRRASAASTSSSRTTTTCPTCCRRRSRS